MVKPGAFDHGPHNHYSETAWQICEYGVEKWLEMQIESTEDLEREEIS